MVLARGTHEFAGSGSSCITIRAAVFAIAATVATVVLVSDHPRVTILLSARARRRVVAIVVIFMLDRDHH
jgi:hypothetical protein